MKPSDSVKVSERGVDNVTRLWDRIFFRPSLTPFNVQDVSYASDAFMAWHLSNAFDLQRFKNEFKVEIIEEAMEDGLSSAVFDVVGIDAPVANALRRNMISRVPTMAFDQVTIVENTSEIPDEILAHRIGLVPLRAPASQFAAMTGASDRFDTQNSLKFTMDVTCVDDASSNVYSSHLRWNVEDAELREKFREADVGPVHPDILLAMLARNQRISLSAIAVVGRGETHAKWSPVGTAFYRMRPEVTISRPVTGANAKALKELCPLNVFDIEDGAAIVADARRCTVCRECIRPEHGFDDAIQLSRKKRHFIFSIESTGAYLARDIFREAIADFKATLLGVQLAIRKTQAQLK
jgi:DNA-directed RNA polymerases I and III subunit RPAC1